MVITKEINSVDIDKESLVGLLKEKGVSLAQASMKIGYSSTYLTKAVSTGKIREAAVQLLEMTYGISRKDFQRKDPPVSLARSDPSRSGIGYTVDLKIMPDKLCFTVKFNGEEVIHSWCKIRGKRELDLFQAISYAAHMCYKFIEQKKLQE